MTPTGLLSRDQILFTRCSVRTATAVAADLGWLHDEFADEGIAVGSLQDGPSSFAHRAERARGLRFEFREGGNVPALWARSRGTPTRLVGLTWVDERQVVLARPGCGLASPADLAGRRIGIPRREHPGVDFRRAIALRGFAGALSASGLELDDVRKVSVDAESMRGARSGFGPWGPELEALRKGEVDAIYMKGALAVEDALRSGAVIVVDLDQLADRRLRVNNGTPRPITVDQRVLDERADIVARFLATTLRAADWVNRDRGESAGRDLHPELSRERLQTLEEQQEFLRAEGFLSDTVDILSWIDPAPLGAARDMLAARREYAATRDQRAAVGRSLHPSSCRPRTPAGDR